MMMICLFCRVEKDVLKCTVLCVQLDIFSIGDIMNVNY